jgi:hypothetical protein
MCADGFAGGAGGGGKWTVHTMVLAFGAASTDAFVKLMSATITIKQIDPAINTLFFFMTTPLLNSW